MRPGSVSSPATSTPRPMSLNAKTPATRHAPLGIRLAQALHHGTDHRSQVCTALTTLGIEPPAIDLWDYGALDGRVFTEPIGAAEPSS
jgi:uncharacterized damage-inducible protein DinB